MLKTRKKENMEIKEIFT